MIKSIFEGNPEFYVPAALPLMLTAFGLGILTINIHDGYGILTIVQVGTLGVSAAWLSGFRTERGIWMLAVLVLIIWGGLYVLGIVMELRDVLRGAASPLAIAMDATASSTVASLHLRFLRRVATANWHSFSKN